MSQSLTQSKSCTRGQTASIKFFKATGTPCIGFNMVVRYLFLISALMTELPFSKSLVTGYLMPSWRMDRRFTK